MTGIMADVTPVDLSDSRSFVPAVPHEWLAHLRRTTRCIGRTSRAVLDTGPSPSTTTASPSTATSNASARPPRAPCPSNWARRRWRNRA